jgi:hypothetical protein
MFTLTVLYARQAAQLQAQYKISEVLNLKYTEGYHLYPPVFLIRDETDVYDKFKQQEVTENNKKYPYNKMITYFHTKRTVRFTKDDDCIVF